MKLEVKKINKKIELDTTAEKCTACMHVNFDAYSKEAYEEGITACYTGVSYDRQYMPIGSLG
ncbi:MAG: hypothetical protein NC399_04050 [Muribaculum sp.]|nr:hypothetical protein [Muribaculum sp.]